MMCLHILVRWVVPGQPIVARSEPGDTIWGTRPFSTVHPGAVPAYEQIEFWG